MSGERAQLNQREDRWEEGIKPDELEEQAATELPAREALTLIDNPLIGGSITAGPTSDSTASTTDQTDPLGFTGSSGADGGSDTSGSSTPTGDSTTGSTDTTTSPTAGATQLGTQTASDGTTLAQDQTTTAASSDDGTYSPQETSVSQT